VAETRTVKVDSKYTQADVEAALRKLEQARAAQARQRERMKTPEAKAAQRERNMRKRVRDMLLIQKAKEAGIVVTPEEVERIVKSKLKAR